MRFTVMSLRSCDVADDAQMVGEGVVGIRRIEIADLGVDIELEHRRHAGFLGGPEQDQAVLVALLPPRQGFGGGGRRFRDDSFRPRGGLGWHGWHRGSGYGRRARRRGGLLRSGALRSVQSLSQSLDHLDERLLLLLEPRQLGADRGVLGLQGLDFVLRLRRRIRRRGRRWPLSGGSEPDHVRAHQKDQRKNHPW